MIGALTLMIAFIFVPFFSQNLPTLLAGEILCGIPWGVFQTLTTAYASEGLFPSARMSQPDLKLTGFQVCPVVLRAYLCTYVNLCWVSYCYFCNSAFTFRARPFLCFRILSRLVLLSMT